MKIGDISFGRSVIDLGEVLEKEFTCKDEAFVENTGTSYDNGIAY